MCAKVPPTLDFSLVTLCHLSIKRLPPPLFYPLLSPPLFLQILDSLINRLIYFFVRPPIYYLIYPLFSTATRFCTYSFTDSPIQISCELPILKLSFLLSLSLSSLSLSIYLSDTHEYPPPPTSPIIPHFEGKLLSIYCNNRVIIQS
jgi:hypothetical protein